MNKEAMCDRSECTNLATVKPVIQLRSHPVMSPCEAFLGLKVCSECATDEEAENLIAGAKQKGMLQDIFKVQTQDRNAVVDWSCSGVIWVRIQ